MSTGYHRKGMEGMVAVVEAILIDKFLVASEIFTVFVQVRQVVVIVFLEQFIERTIRRELLIVKITITNRGNYDDAIVGHNSFMPNNIC